jgi:hypothetical protein
LGKCDNEQKYRIRQKYLTNLQNSSEWNLWRGEFVLERTSSETHSISVAIERWSVEHRAFAVDTYFKKQRFCRDSEDILSALQYSSERMSLVAILLPLRISQEQDVRKETKDNGGFETEHQGKSGSNFSQHAATSDVELPETLGGNVFTTSDATSQTLYSGCGCCNEPLRTVRPICRTGIPLPSRCCILYIFFQQL